MYWLLKLELTEKRSCLFQDLFTQDLKEYHGHTDADFLIYFGFAHSWIEDKSRHYKANTLTLTSGMPTVVGGWLAWKSPWIMEACYDGKG